ncbi:MAG: SDR family oxidoreductase [Gaiellaceae bacterium MAG52_C11]|nr:SDR family oxidoreductase [Candidatus Gaiellasilicea maunaloa]
MSGSGLADRVVLVTGARSGIGAATTRALRTAGAKIVAADRTELDLPDAIAEADPGEAVAIEVDVATEHGVWKAVETCRERFGRLDGLVANAAISRSGTADDTTPAVWDEVIATNLRSVYLAAHYGVPLMRESGGGSFVAVASQLGLVGKPRAAAYCAAKGGVVNLVRAMALDHAPDNIRVNCVCPGPTETPMLQQDLGASSGSASVREQIRHRVPMSRFGKPEEVASTIIFLLSDATTFVTGAAWTVDGGYLAA